MRYTPADRSLFIHNRQEFVKQLKPNSIVVIKSNDIYPKNADGLMNFHQNADLYYLSGIDQEESVLLLFPDTKEEQHREVLFILETNEQLAIWEGEKISKKRATELSGVSNIQWVENFDKTFFALTQQADNIYLNTNEHPRMTTKVETANDRFINECKSLYPLHNYERLAPITYKQRMVKHEEEVKMIQHACDITKKGFLRLLGFIKPGVGEWEIEAELIHEFTRNKSKGFAYSPIIASGFNACVLHYIENNSKVKDGEVILLDVAAEYGNWQSDLTRSVPANGKFTERQRAVYDAVLRVFRFANSILRPGVYPKDYQNQVIEFMEKQLIDLGLIDADEAAKQDASKPLVKKYFMHGTSHHLGLDVHDVCLPNTPFQVGNVVTVEPGIYIREESLGIRLENDILIGERENIDLMASIPIEADEIEALMAESI